MYNEIRPQYETQHDRDRETTTKYSIMRKLNCTFVKVPKDYRVDYAVTMKGNKIVGWAEIKCRNNSSTMYPTYMISLKKISEGLRLSEITHQPFYLFVQFTDKLMQYNVKPTDPIEYSIGGRSVQTRNSQDIEPCAYIKMELFTEVVDANKH
jgi:hypothetical protein